MELKRFRYDPAIGEKLWLFRCRLYRDDPNWITPSRDSFVRRFTPGFTFADQPNAEHEHIVITDQGNIIAHAMVSWNPLLLDDDGTPVGTIGMFEAIDDSHLDEDLFCEAVEWFAQRGCRRIWGPMDFDIWTGYRFMTSGFDLRTFAGEPYNKRSYPERWEQLGFRVRQEWDSVELVGRTEILSLVHRGLQRIDALLEKGYQFNLFDLEKPDESIRTLYEILSDSFQGFLGYTKIAYDQFAQRVRAQFPAIDQRTFLLIRDEQGRPAGFAGAQIELGDAVRAMHGSSSVVAKARFAFKRSRSTRSNFYFGGITKAEAMRKSGLGRAGFTYVARAVARCGYERMVVALRTVDNPSRAYTAGFNSHNRRTYALYQLDR